MGEQLDRGPGTPDFVLGLDKKRPASHHSIKGRVGELMRNGEDGISSPLASGGDGAASGNGYGSRPRLTSRLRSFFTSFSAAEAQLGSDFASFPSKARTSNEFTSQPAIRSKSAIEGNAVARPQGLVIPSARPAAFGQLGLNDDSPPLTPQSDEEREYLKYHPDARRQWLGAHDSSASSGSESYPTSLTTHPDSSVSSLSADHKPAISLGSAGALASGLSPAFANGQQPSRPLSRLSLHDLGDRIQAGLRSKSLRQHMPTLLMLLTFFVFSTLVVFVLLTTLPLRFPAHGLTQLSLAEIRDICMSLREYANSTPQAYHYTLMVLCLFFTYLQAFNVPGSIICNVVFGALFGAWRATFWLSIFTAVGGSGASVMSALVAPLVLKIPGMAKAVEVMRRALGKANKATTSNGSIPMKKRSPTSPTSRSTTPRLRAASPHPSGKNKASSSRKSTGGNLFSVLLLLRLLPLTPYGMMNIACGILNVPLVPFASTLAIGSVPWNAVTAQLGEILLDVVAAFPVDDETFSEADLALAGAGASQGLSMGDQLDAGGFRNVPRPGAIASAASGGIHNVLSSEKSKLSSAAHKAGGGIKILLAKIWTREMILKLIGLSLLSITPVLLGKWWKARQARQSAAASKARKARLAAERERDYRLHEQQREQQQQQQQMRGQHLYPHAAPSAVQPNSVAAAVLEWSDGEHEDGTSSYGGSSHSTPDYEYDGEGDEDEEDDSTYEYDDDDDDGDEDGDDEDEGDRTIGRRSSKLGFAAMADSTPAFIANLTRSASRNSWNSGWLKAAVGASPAPAASHNKRHSTPMSLGLGSSDPASSWPSSDAGEMPPPVTTPQLELARNPFDSAPGSYSATSWQTRQSPQRPNFFDGSQRGGGAAAAPASIDFSVHPALASSNTTANGNSFQSHSRQSSHAGGVDAAGPAREPRRLHATLRVS